MTLPISTTTISILRIPWDDHEPRDPLDPRPAAEVIATGIPAHISTSTGIENINGSAQEVVTYRLNCDPTDVTFEDQILDERTNDIYEVTWTRERVEFVGLEYIQGGLKKVTGLP